MSQKFVVVFEAPADFTTATELADRVLMESIGWLEPKWLDPVRDWIRETPDGKPLTWKSISRRARENGITVRGKAAFGREVVFEDARAARRAMALIKKLIEDTDAIVLIRDLDNQPDRLSGLRQAKVAEHGAVGIVIAAANPERECWVISGFEPLAAAEQEQLALETQELGGDPRLCSQELTAGSDDQAKRSPKRILKSLSGGDPNREARCWRETDLSVLHDRGQENGLADYLREVNEILVPLIGGDIGRLKRS